VQRVNEQVDINIIVATGLYTFDEIPHFFHYRGPDAILDGPELMTAALKTGLIAQRILKEEGVDLTKVVIGHCGDTTDLDCLRRDRRRVLAARHGPFRHRRVLAVRGPRHHGRGAGEGRLRGSDVLAHDASCYSDFYSESYKAALLPRWNYTHITDDVLPALREHGVDEAQITAMLVHTPARYFTGGQE
jgi:phosphotriesterase-related protein